MIGCGMSPSVTLLPVCLKTFSQPYCITAMGSLDVEVMSSKRSRRRA